MNCCSAKGCDEFFTERVARRDAARYRRTGIDGSAQPVVDFVREHGVEGSSVLEVGGGVGAIQLELLKAGAARAENVELSPAYEPYAAELLQARGRRTGRASPARLRNPGGRGPACRRCRPAQGRLLLPRLRGACGSSRGPRQAPARCSPSRAGHGGCGSDSASSNLSNGCAAGPSVSTCILRRR